MCWRESSCSRLFEDTYPSSGETFPSPSGHYIQTYSPEKSASPAEAAQGTVQSPHARTQITAELKHSEWNSCTSWQHICSLSQDSQVLRAHGHGNVGVQCSHSSELPRRNTAAAQCHHFWAVMAPERSCKRFTQASTELPGSLLQGQEITWRDYQGSERKEDNR